MSVSRSAAAWAAFGFLAVSPAAWAQVPYQITVETVAWFPLTQGTTHQPVGYAFGYQAWDEGAAEVAIPFSFRWFGRSYDRVWVYTNGLVSFDPPPTGPAQDILRPPAAVPAPQNVPHNFIAAMWRNLNSAGSPEIRSAVEGSAPNRTLVLQLTGMRAEPGTAAQRVAFQVRLEEATGSARVTYHPNEVFASSSVAAIEDAQGVLGGNLLAASASCTGTCPCAIGACSSTNYAIPGGMPDQSRSVVIRPPLTAELIGAIDGPDGAYPGTNFSATVLVSNVGLGNAAASSAEVRLSADTTIDGSDTLLRALAIPALAAGATSSTTVVLTMPMGLPVQRFYLGVIVDPANAIPEAVENNNSARDPGGIVTGPDLVATLAAPLSSGPGETVVVDLALRSRGAPVTGQVAVAFFLSEDATLDGADTPLGTQSFTLPGGFSADLRPSVVMPLAAMPRAYRLIARIDPAGAISETDETNNVAVSLAAITLSLPELAVAEVTSDPVAFRGMPLVVSTRLTNQGGTTARGFTTCLLISRNQLISVVSDPILVQTGAMDLAGGGTAALRFEPVIAAGTGTGSWELAVVADCEEAISEGIETDNVRRRATPITILDPSPDLTPVALATDPTGAAGEALAVALTIGNIGTAPGGGRVRLLLSDNAGVSGMDTLVYEGAMPVPLDPAAEIQLALDAQLPSDLSSGDYWIGAEVDFDQQLPEVRDDNNLLVIGPFPVVGSDLAIIGPNIPNAVLGVPYAWRFYALGGDGTYAWTLEWAAGNAPAGLSFDPAAGELAGTPLPQAEGNYGMTVRVTSGSLSASRTMQLLVTPPTIPLNVISGRLPPALKEERYSVQLVAVGGTPPYQWSIERGALPAGLGLAASGEVSGEALEAGAATLTVAVVDGASNRATGDIAIDVIDPAASITITSADVPAAMVGEGYSFQFEVQGGTAPHRWRLDGTSVPGLRFDGDAAILTGTPTVAGSFPLVVEVRDSKGLLDRNAYLLRVFELGDLSIVTGRSDDAKLPRGKEGQPYLAADGGPVRLEAAHGDGTPVTGLRWMIVLGQLPPGLGFDPDSGTISGSPTSAGVSAFTVLAYDSRGDQDRITLALEVEPATPPVAGTEGCSCRGSRPSGAGGLGLLLLAVLLLFKRACR